jgi:thiol-disulfide isomerase/thioredoxin
MRGLFFLLGVLGIVLAINVNLSAKPAPSIFPTVDQFEMEVSEGFVANFYVDIPRDNNNEVVECQCDGSKKIKSGDGLISVDCPCMQNGKCECKKNTGSAGANPVTESSLSTGNPFSDLKKKYAVVYVGAVWCGPCHWVNDNSFPLLKERKWSFGDKQFSYTVGPEMDNMIITVDYDEKEMGFLRDFLSDDMEDIKLPTFFKIDIQNKKIVSKIVGNHDAAAIHRFYSEKN